MREGFFAIFYTGKAGSGLGLIALTKGTIIGVDSAGALYDGSYKSDSDVAPLTGTLSLHVAANVPLVTGAMPEPEPYLLNFPLDLPGNFADAVTPHTIRTAKGSVNIIFKKLRNFNLNEVPS